MAERGVTIVYTTVLRWVQRFVPAFEKKWKNYARPVGWTSEYLNNLIEQNHRMAKRRCYPMLGFKTFGNTEVTLSGIELANKIKKGQFNTSEITSPRAMILQVWEAVLAA